MVEALAGFRLRLIAQASRTIHENKNDYLSLRAIRT